MELGEALERHGDSLMGVPGVVGIGETELDGKQAVMIMLTEDSDAIRAALPETVAGYPVVIDVTGAISALPAAGEAGEAGEAVAFDAEPTEPDAG